MSNKDYLNLYKDIFSESKGALITSGRYALSHFNYKKRLANDIKKKLNLNLKDSVLDLGCNVGIYHPYFHQKIEKLLGVDGVKEIIEKTSIEHKPLGFQYQCFDILDVWPKIPDRYNKVIVYSVIHFFDSIEDIERLLCQIDNHCDSHYSILLGEVRTKKKYENFLSAQNQKKYLSFRNWMFKIKKIVNNFYLRNIDQNVLKPTIFESKDLFELGHKMGLEVKEIDQDSYHPFYNTCSDFLLVKK